MEQATAGQIQNQNQRQPQSNRQAVPATGNSQPDELKGLGMMMQQLLQGQQNTEQSASSGATAPSEPAETPPLRVYVPKVPYPIPPKHLMDPISAEQLAGFKKMVRRLPQNISLNMLGKFGHCICSSKIAENLRRKSRHSLLKH
ncbi:hypothetical protein F2Q69_00014352 [Brassica cretica]|uniref:Uncharacterized protein n=1 Tax=Brassica cretica TaxID=69181 RepID=A0A8S9QYQ8_BRACR|nr:hypothetical protein F2Q69_00014352 [Brassica cretica]